MVNRDIDAFKAVEKNNNLRQKMAGPSPIAHIMRNQLISHEMPAVHPAKKINCMQGDSRCFKMIERKSKEAGDAGNRNLGPSVNPVSWATWILR